MKRLLTPLALAALLGCATISREPFMNLYNGQTSLGSTTITSIINQDPDYSGIQVRIEKGDTTVVMFNKNPEKNDMSLADPGDKVEVKVTRYVLFSGSATFAYDYFIAPTGERLEMRLIETYSLEQIKKLQNSKTMLENRFTDLYRTAIREAYNSEGWNRNIKVIDPEPK